MKKLIFPIIIILSAIAIVIIFLLLSSKENVLNTEDGNIQNKDQLIEETIDEKNARDEINNNGLEVDSNVQSSSGGGGSGGGGGGSSSSTPGSSSSSSCPHISYALKSFIRNSVCLSYSNDICIDKEVYCSLTVENLGQSSGQFTIEFTLINLQTSSSIQQFQISKTISSSNQEIFDKTVSFQSSSVEGEANQDYDCSFNTLEIPSMPC